MALLLGLQGRRPDEVARTEFNRTGDWFRNLERRGFFPPAPRDHQGYRVLTPEYVELIKAIVLEHVNGRVMSDDGAEQHTVSVA
jgi:hypothetical protein